MWLFEEAHMWTKDAKEASLKLLENPPKRCWFVLTTSDPQKFFSGLKDAGAMKRRLTHFEVEPVSDRELSSLLFRVAKQERKRVPKTVVEQIVKDSLGSPGMALNVLDKVIDLPEEQMAKVAEQAAIKASNIAFLGKTLQDLRKKRSAQSWSKVLCPILKEFEGQDQESIRRAVYEYFRKVFISGDESAYKIMACFSYPYYDVGNGLAASVYEAFCQE
jgi:DNA polymerase III gamma/tau subunit